jgi:hypothetical protein
MIVSVKPCINCGADKVEDYQYYDGALGYEALICKRCGFVYDHAGIHPPEPQADCTERSILCIGCVETPCPLDGKEVKP